GLTHQKMNKGKVSQARRFVGPGYCGACETQTWNRIGIVRERATAVKEIVGILRAGKDERNTDQRRPGRGGGGRRSSMRTRPGSGSGTTPKRRSSRPAGMAPWNRMRLGTRAS